MVARVLQSLIAAVGRVPPGLIPVAVAFLFVGCLIRGLHARAAFRMLELPASLGAMTGMSASSYAVNKVVKSGGVAGVAAYLTEARHRHLDRSRVVGAYVAVRLSDSLASCACIVAALALGAASGASHGVMLIGLLVALAYGVGLVAAAFAMTRSRARFDAVLAGPRWCLRRVRRWVGRADPDGRVHAQSDDELFAAISALRSTPRRCGPLLAAAAAGKLISALSLYVILAAVGVHVGIATTVVIFVLTLVASAFGPLPAGLGTTEASLGTLLVAHGVAGAVAAGAVLLFRVLDLWLPIAVGGVAALVRARFTAIGTPTAEPSLAVVT
jgi:uncharacterized protein (TIRG00374 family)